LDLPNFHPACVQSDNIWFPRLSGQLGNLKEQLRQGLDEAAADHGPLNRAQRRAIEANKREGKLIAAAKAIAPQFSEKYALPVDLVERTILPLLRGKCTEDAASRRLFNVVAEPSAFVHAYFKVQRRDQSALNFINEFGKNLERSLTEFRRNAEPFMLSNQNIEHLRNLLRRDIGKFSAVLLRMIETEEGEQAVTPAVLQTISNQPDSVATIPACTIASQIMLGYLEQTVAAEKPSKIERGFGGDLMHALYIDCVDIWRSDGRFAELVRQRLPDRAHKVQPKLQALPEQIVRLADCRN
jgi:hypothetical protein